MSKGAYTALETVGLVIASLSAQALIRGWFNEDSEPLWGIFNGVPGGLTGQMSLLGFIALVGIVLGAWAHTCQKRHRAAQ